jgi:hypothetical protein
MLLTLTQISQRQGFDPTRQQASLFGQYVQLLAQICQKVPIVLLLDNPNRMKTTMRTMNCY